MNAAKLVPSFRLLLLAGAVIVPAALIAVLPGWQELGYLLIGAAGLAAIADAFLAPRRVRHISVQTGPLVRMWKDRTTVIDLIIRNEAQQEIALRIGLLFPPEIVPPQEEQRTVLPAAAEFSRIQWECTPLKRGQYFITQCVVERPSALGLWDVRKTLPLQLEIRVYPNLAAERKKSPAFFKRGRLGMNVQRQLGKGREFEKLREYASGDSFEDVDWKATARRGHPITRVFQVERTQEIYIVLDASRLTARPVPNDPNATILERNVTASLLLALAAEKQGDLFGLITFSDRVHKFVRARNGKAHYSACRDALYMLHARAVTPDFEELFSLLRLRLRRRALLIFLTELDDPIVAETFVRNLKLLRQHLLLVGMTRPAGAQPLFEDSQVDAVDDVYKKLAGHISWNKLRELGKVLASQGVRFSLLDADTLGPELATIYLDLKQRQLL
ncbi:MAG TPA: DUF58 domain-containing protein [Bryobacteraceae bacterium]